MVKRVSAKSETRPQLWWALRVEHGQPGTGSVRVYEIGAKIESRYPQSRRKYPINGGGPVNSNEVQAALSLICLELRHFGSATKIDGNGVLATLLPPQGDQTEGHFRVDHRDDGTWRIGGRSDDEHAIEVTDRISANALAALSSELLLEARIHYCAEQDLIVPPSLGLPLPPPYVRRMPKDKLAEATVAEMTGGELATPGNKGFDVLANGHHRVQVKSTVRNPSSGLISTLNLRTGPSYSDHDELIYIVFSPANYPEQAWSIDSEVLRDEIPPTDKTVQVEQLLQNKGNEITNEVRTAFENRLMRLNPERIHDQSW